MKRKLLFLHALTLALALAGCGESAEPERIPLAIEVDPSALPEVANDLGYVVALKQARVAVRDLHFTVQGEEHASLLRRVVDAIVPPANAHPGHLADGTVTGELPGAFTLWFGTGEPHLLGQGTFLPGRYNGMNFGFDAALEGGHTARLEGTATRDGKSVAFTANLDVPAGTQLVGAPVAFELSADARPTLVVRFLPKDSGSATTVFDLVDFAALDADGDSAVSIEPGSEAANAMRRALQSHVFYAVHVQEE